MSTHLTLLRETLRLRRTPELYDAAIAAALVRPGHSTGHSMLMDLIGDDDNVTTEQRHTLLTFPHERVRHAAWHQFGQTAPISLWEAAVRTETDPDVLTAMDVTAPWQDLPRATINRLVDDPEGSTRFSATAAERILALTFRDGMQDVWREALEVVDPDSCTRPFIEKALNPVHSGQVRGLSADAHRDILLAQACSPVAPDGSITEVLARHPELLDPATSPSQPLVHACISSVARTPVGRSRDLETLLDFTLGGILPTQIRPLLQHLPLRASGAEMMAYVVDDVSSDTTVMPRFFGPDLLANWNRLNDADRTDELCLAVITTPASPTELVAAAVNHLGARAGDLLEEETLRASNRNLVGGPFPAWVRLTDRPLWVQMLRRLEDKPKLAFQLSTATPEDVTAAAEDLLAHPDMWHSHTIAPLASAAGFGPDEWALLAPTQVLAIGQDNPDAVEWLTSQLAGAELGKTTVALAADQALTDDTSIADTLAALKAFA